MDLQSVVRGDGLRAEAGEQAFGFDRYVVPDRIFEARSAGASQSIVGGGTGQAGSAECEADRASGKEIVCIRDACGMRA